MNFQLKLTSFLLQKKLNWKVTKVHFKSGVKFDLILRVKENQCKNSSSLFWWYKVDTKQTKKWVNFDKLAYNNFFDNIQPLIFKREMNNEQYYGNTGNGFSSPGIQNYWTLRIAVMRRCQKVPKFDIQSQFSMSKIIKNFLTRTTQSLKINNIKARITLFWCFEKKKN